MFHMFHDLLNEYEKSRKSRIISGVFQIHINLWEFILRIQKLTNEIYVSAYHRFKIEFRKIQFLVENYNFIENPSSHVRTLVPLMD